jgi:hypothetical protein
LYKSDYVFRTSWDNVTPKIPASIPHKLKYVSKRVELPKDVQDHIDKYLSPVYKLDHHKGSSKASQSRIFNAYSYLLLKHNIRNKMTLENQRTKYLLVGSGPGVQSWIQNHLQWFLAHDYKIIVFNNSWKTVPLRHIFAYYKPNDSQKHGTFIPSNSELKEMNKIVEFHGDKQNMRHFYLNYGKTKVTTMFFNALYYLLTQHVYSFSVVVVGCDMIYKKNGDTFYSHLNISKATNDPVNKYSDEELSNELKNIQKQYDYHSCDISNASLMSETRLPFRRFSDYM